MTTDENERIVHAHRLVRRIGNTDEDDPHNLEVSSNNDFKAMYVCVFYNAICILYICSFILGSTLCICVTTSDLQVWA